MFVNLKRISTIAIFSCILSFIFAESTQFEGLYRYKLPNGLELFVAENNSAPLAYIEVAVRAGAVTQTPDNAGLFHLFEHMLFKGNEKYADQQEFTRETNRMGAIDQNGSTGIDRVNYYFTVPSNMVKRGLEFWSYAIRTPKLDETELENEKAVVLAEINADFTDPSHIRAAGIAKSLFPDSEYRLDPGGDPVVVKEATSNDLVAMQKRYYTPENSAIFVGGDVKHSDIFNYVTEIFGDWQNPTSKPQFIRPPSYTPESDVKLVLVTPEASDDMIQVGYYLRGPDGETDAQDTYPADVMVALLDDPNGLFSKTFVSTSQLSIPESDYVSSSYLTRRASGTIAFYASMLTDSASPTTPAPVSSAPKVVKPDTNYGFGSFKVIKEKPKAKIAELPDLPSGILSPVEKADGFLTILKKQAVPALVQKQEFFEQTPISTVIQQLEDSRIYELESAKYILSSLSFFWSACGTEYFFNYDDNIKKVTEDDVVSFVQKYVQDKYGVLLVTVSPAIWQKYKDSFVAHGYEELTAENAFWQK